MASQYDGIGSAEEPAPGSQLVVSRRGYRHHGIYVGAGRVIHYAGRIRYPHGLVEEVSLTDFSDGRPFRMGRVPDERVGATIVRRARSRLGERCYDLFRNNCEHFCNWCLVGEPRSAQVESLTWFGRLLLLTLERLALLVMSSIWAAESSCSAMRRGVARPRIPGIRGAAYRQIGPERYGPTAVAGAASYRP